MERFPLYPEPGGKDLGGCEGGVPLTVLPGREVTSDTLALSRAASLIPFRICFDLGTGTGEVLGNMCNSESLRIGIDNSMEALSLFDRKCGQPVLCPVERVQRTFRKGCADLVLANPPYNVNGRGRPSPDPCREHARSADQLVLHRFIFAGAHLLRPGGLMIITERLERKHDIELGFLAAGFNKPELLWREGVVLFSGSLREPRVPQDCRGEVGSV